MWGLCCSEEQCKLLQSSLPANACLLNPKHSPRTWEVKIPMLRGLAESLRTEKENQGALKCPKGGSQWLWVSVSVSVKEEGWTTGSPGPFPTRPHRFASKPREHRGAMKKTGTEKSTLGSERGFQKEGSVQAQTCPKPCKKVWGWDSLLLPARDGAGANEAHAGPNNVSFPQVGEI